MTKRTNKQYPSDFKQEAVALETQQGYTVVEAAASLNIKKGFSVFRKRNEIKYSFITSLGKQYPVAMSCKVMRVSKSAYYAWRKRPAIIISAQTLNLHRRAKALFEASRDSLGSRQWGKKLRNEGFDITRHRVIQLMKCLSLVDQSSTTNTRAHDARCCCVHEIL